MDGTARRIFFGLASVLLLGLAMGASDLQRPAPEAEQTPADRPFRLKAAGQIDLATFEITFGGVATHLGLYTAAGFLDPGDSSILGTMEAANGDTLDFTASFSLGPLGEIQAEFEFDGGTGRFADATGSASGPVTLDPDFSFLITATGDLDY